MYSREEFVERFKDMETAWLLNRLATTELTDEARDAIHDVLRGRGVPMESLSKFKPDIPDHEVVEHARRIKLSTCPRCRRTEGGLEVRKSYWVWSALIITRWQTKSDICCRDCGVNENWSALISSVGLGWWGIPAGIIVTPCQIVRNILAIAKKSDTTEPSGALLDYAKKHLLAQRQLELERTAR